MAPFCLQRVPGGGVVPPPPGFRVYPCVRLWALAFALHWRSARLRALPCRRLALAVQLAFLCGLGFGLTFAVPHGSTASCWPRAMSSCELRTTWPPTSQVIV